MVSHPLPSLRLTGWWRRCPLLTRAKVVVSCAHTAPIHPQGKGVRIKGVVSRACTAPLHPQGTGVRQHTLVSHPLPSLRLTGWWRRCPLLTRAKVVVSCAHTAPIHPQGKGVRIARRGNTLSPHCSSRGGGGGGPLAHAKTVQCRVPTRTPYTRKGGGVDSAHRYPLPPSITAPHGAGGGVCTIDTCKCTP